MNEEASPTKKPFLLELGVPIGLIVIAAAFLWDSRNISEMAFDSLGPAPIPRLICWCVILLSAVVMGQVMLASKSPAGKVTTPNEEAAKPQPLLALATLGFTVLYVIAMAFRFGSFAIITSVYLMLTISVLSRFNKKAMIIGAVIALIMGFGCQYLFTEIFVIDLPTGAK